jgi:hypothetical protein
VECLVHMVPQIQSRNGIWLTVTKQNQRIVSRIVRPEQVLLLSSASPASASATFRLPSSHFSPSGFASQWNRGNSGTFQDEDSRPSCASLPEHTTGQLKGGEERKGKGMVSRWFPTWPSSPPLSH